MPPKGNGDDPSIASYTSWDSLTDRNWFSRHLPPKDPPQDPLNPSSQRVAELFVRREPVLSEDSTVLFLAFAQWFTDGFLMTDAIDRRLTHSRHEVDLGQLYGCTRQQTHAVRMMSESRGEKGRLKFQNINGEIYAPYLYGEDGRKKGEFALLPDPMGLDEVLALLDRANPAHAAKLRSHIFAFASERANTTPFTALMNTLFLREHNRLAAMIEEANPGWDDERIFQTARNINIVLLINIVIAEYINHISANHFRLFADPSVAWKAHWNRPNWIPVEFNVLYRWHCLVPDEFVIEGQPVRTEQIVFDNSRLTEIGLARLAVSASEDRACRVGLFNTARCLTERGLELAAINQGRANRLRPYNDYRELFGFPRVTQFNQITGDPQRAEALSALYDGDPDNVEFFVGLFAEDVLPGYAVPPLMARMISVDAFTHAFTNPLLSEQVFNERTFTKEGLAVINEKRHLRLEDLVNRNCERPAPVAISMTWKAPAKGRAAHDVPVASAPQLRSA
jgi:prostaglandin-endoperoxide synthase 2